MFNKYLSLVQNANDFLITTRIINFIGIVYSLGLIVSIFIGPIYPLQLGDTMSLWGGLRIQQGVGFGVNQNSVGGILVLLFIFYISFVNSKFNESFIINVIKK